MDYAFPADLAAEVIRRWDTFAARQDAVAPALPAERELRHILETAFFASLEREERRALRFVLCCAPEAVIVRDGFGDPMPLVPFETRRAVSVASIRALAPAVSPDNAALLVRCANEPGGGPCEIAGVLHVGGNLARARSGRSFYSRPAPSALVVDVRDAGELHIYRGDIKLAALKAGRLHDQIAFSTLEFLPMSELLSHGQHVLRARVTEPASEPRAETSDFEWTAHLNTMLSIVNGVKEHGHGGTVLVVAPDAGQTLPIRTTYDVGARADVLSDRFIGFLNARHALADVLWRQKRRGMTGEDHAALLPLQNATFLAEEHLADAAELVARLSAVDGALVIGSDLRVIGFGAEIVLDTAVPIAAYEVVGSLHRSGGWPAVDTQSFGMRHRSALRCVSVADGTAAFVVSQDGTVSFCWRQGGDVFLKRNVNTANPGLVGS